MFKKLHPVQSLHKTSLSLFKLSHMHLSNCTPIDEHDCRCVLFRKFLENIESLLHLGTTLPKK
jgi:hypothetical protein